MKTWSKIKIDGYDVWTQTPKETKSFYNKLNKLKGDDLRLEIAKPFLPKNVLKMTKKNQIKYINKSDDEFYNSVMKVDIKFTKTGDVKEKGKSGKWEYV